MLPPIVNIGIENATIERGTAAKQTAPAKRQHPLAIIGIVNNVQTLTKSHGPLKPQSQISTAALKQSTPPLKQAGTNESEVSK